MKSNNRIIVYVFTAIGLSVLACILPGATAPTPFLLPTPDLTRTAIFSLTPGAPATFVDTATPVQDKTSTPLTSTATIPPPSPTEIPPTYTATATNTTVPPISYAGPGVRPGVSVVAVYLNQEPTIDGVFDEWNLDRDSVASVVYGASNWNGAGDLSSMIMLGWDENNLYIAARVKDDVYVQSATGKNLFKGDSIEILIDTDVSGDFYLSDLDGDDFQLGISPGSPQPGTAPETYLWYPQSVAGSRQKVKAGATTKDDGYRIEVKVPWSILGISPSQGQHFGFAFSVSDNDNADKAVQQSMVSNVPTRKLTDPTTWGDLTLSRANPKKRSGASMDAVYLNNPPSIDGNLADWALNSASVVNVVFGGDKWDSAADLSGAFMVGWDEDNIYIGAKVIDNRYVQNSTGVKLFMGDSLEILLDTDVSSDFYQKSLSGDDYQLGISPGNPNLGTNDGAYLWYPISKAGPRSQVDIAAIAVADGYTVEVLIPWSVFGVSPGSGQHYGFVLSLSDNDNLNKNIQQSMVSSVPTRKLTDPTTWGDLTLIKP